MNAMYEHFNKIFWGILFTLVDINLGSFDIIPDFVGYGFMISGLVHLYHETQQKDFYIAHIFAIISLIQSCIGLFYRADMMTHMSYLGMIYSTGSQIIGVLLVFYTYTGMIHILDNSQNQYLVETLITSRRNYVYVVMTTIFIMTFLPNMNRGGLGLGVVVVVFINLAMVIRWAHNVYTVRNHYQYSDEILEEK